MEVVFPRRVIADIEAHAKETYPEECCGFLIGTESGEGRVVTEGRRAKNVHPEMRNARYTIDPRDVLKLDREFPGDVRPIGFYHSHPDHPPEPSAHDLERAWRYYVYAILQVQRREPFKFGAWRLDEDAKAFQSVSIRVTP